MENINKDDSNDNDDIGSKNAFLFHLKSSFRSRDIPFFVIFPLLSTLFRFKRTNGSEIIYDVMNCIG